MRTLLATAAAVSWTATLTSAAATVPTYNDRDNLCAARRLGGTQQLRPNPIDPIASDDGDFFGIDDIFNFGKRVFFGSSAAATATNCRNLPPIVNDDADTPFSDVWQMIAGLGSVGNVVPPYANDDADTPFGDVWKMITGSTSVGPPYTVNDDFDVPFKDVWEMMAGSGGSSGGSSSSSSSDSGGDGCSWRTELAEITFVALRVVGGGAVSGNTGITRIAGRTFSESAWNRARSFVDGYEIGTGADGVTRTLQQTFTTTLSPGTNAAPLLMPALAAASWVEMEVVRVQVDSRYGAERVSLEVQATGPLRDVSVLDGVVTVSMAPVRLQHTAPDAQCVEGTCFPPDPTGAPATDAPPTAAPATNAPRAATTPSLSDAIRQAVIRVRHRLTLRNIGRGIKAEVRRLVDATARTIGDALTGGLGGGTTVTCLELCCAVEPSPPTSGGGGKVRVCWSSCDLDSTRWSEFAKAAAAAAAAGGAERAGAVAQAGGDAEVDLQGKSMSAELEVEVVGASITVGAVGQIVTALEEDKTLEKNAGKEGLDVLVENLGVTDHGFRGGEAGSDDGSNTKKKVAIALGVTGGVLLLAIVGGLVFFCTRGKEAGGAEQAGPRGGEQNKEAPESIPDGATETTAPF